VASDRTSTTTFANKKKTTKQDTYATNTEVFTYIIY